MATKESWRRAALTYRNLAGDDIKKEARDRRALALRLGVAFTAPLVVLAGPAFAQLPLPSLPGLTDPLEDVDLLLEDNLVAKPCPKIPQFGFGLWASRSKFAQPPGGRGADSYIAVPLQQLEKS